MIEDDLIRSIESTSIENIECINCSGKFAIAGLFECHAHLAALTTEDENHKKDLLKELANKNESWENFQKRLLENFVKKGITQVRDVGGPIDNISALHQKISKEKLPMPDIFYSGPMLEKSPLSWEENNSTLPNFTVAIDSIEDLNVLDEIKAKGGSLVKTFGKFDSEIYSKLVQKATQLGLPVTHDPGFPALNAIPMNVAISKGATCIEHGKAPLECTLIPELQTKHDHTYSALTKFKQEYPGKEIPENIISDIDFIFDEFVRLKENAICGNKLNELTNEMVTNDIYFCPTLNVFDGDEDADDPIVSTVCFLQTYLTKKLIEGGVKILVGHDGAFAEKTFTEMKLLSNAGLSIPEIIRGATIYPAKWLKVDDRYGSLTPSKKANICILNSNPLASLENITDVHMVIKNGKIVFNE